MIIGSILTAAAVLAIGAVICTSSDSDSAAAALAQMNSITFKNA